MHGAPQETLRDLFESGALYVVITDSLCAGRSGLDILDACLVAGVRLIQFREKSGPDRILYEKARAFRERTRAAEALLIVDDRVDLALAVEADGVHLGQEDMPLSVARQIAPGLILGASTHSLKEALEAQRAGADYVNIGPLFPTGTKAAAAGPVGPQMIAAVRPRLRIPFTCMGGIKPENVHLPLAQGARICAVVTAVTAAPDPRAAAEDLIRRIRKGISSPASGSEPQE